MQKAESPLGFYQTSSLEITHKKVNKDKQQEKYQPVLDDLTCASGIIRAGRPGTLWG